MVHYNNQGKNASNLEHPTIQEGTMNHDYGNGETLHLLAQCIPTSIGYFHDPEPRTIASGETIDYQ